MCRKSRGRAVSEWRGQFRTDQQAFLDPQLVELATDGGVLVRPRVPSVEYRAFADPSGGASDSFALAVAHAENDEVVLDCVVERPAPFNPAEVVRHMAGVLREFGLTIVRGDRHAAGWVVEAFAACGVEYAHHDRDRSAVYLDETGLFSKTHAEWAAATGGVVPLIKGDDAA